jgi:hypothetical protein
MNQMPVWEQALIAVVTVLVVLWVRPGLKATLEQSRCQKGESQDKFPYHKHKKSPLMLP